MITLLKDKVPAAFRTVEEGARVGASKHYQFMTTFDVISTLGAMGWEVHDAKQQKSKKNPDTCKHLIRFRHNDFGTIGEKGNVPEILFVNSHDRTTSLNFHVGVFRLICENGLIIADRTFDQFRIRHMGTQFEAVKALISHITLSLPDVFTSINRFEHVMMSTTKQEQFAAKAFAIRYPEYVDEKTNEINTDLIRKNVDLADLLKVRRNEDNGADLWRVYNRVQESLIKGGYVHVGENNKPKQARAITNIQRDLTINKGLWTLAEEYTN